MVVLVNSRERHNFLEKIVRTVHRSRNKHHLRGKDPWRMREYAAQSDKSRHIGPGSAISLDRVPWGFRLSLDKVVPREPESTEPFSKEKVIRYLRV